MKILFVYPDIITKMINFCPAVHVLSAVLKREGCEVEMLHINNEHGIKYDKDTIIELSKGYDLYAITSTSFNYKYANEIAGWLRDNGRLVILGGSHATIQPEDFDSSNFDIFCVGEGEEPMKDLVYALRSGSDWTKIPNLITRSGVNPVRGFLKDLDKLPFWDFDITDTAKILELRKGWLSISFSRGCAYECTFCHNHLYKKIELGANDKMSDYLRRRSAVNAVDELESLIKKYKIKFFNIDDDLLTTNKKWMKEFTDLYAEKIYKPYSIKYVLNVRPTTMNDEIAKMLADSGCKEARLGLETGNEKLRNELLLKRTSNDDLLKAFASLNKYGIMPVVFVMIGIPGESHSTFFDTINLITELKPKLIRMNFLFPYKHTRIHDICLERGLFKDEAMPDNRDMSSPLKFENLTDKELFCFRFLFPWFVNCSLSCNAPYWPALEEFCELSLSELEKGIPEIIARDKWLSEQCKTPHYRYYGNNHDYFEFYEL